MKFWQQHLTTKIASSFLLLSLITVGVVGSVTFINARNALKKAAFERLNVIATLKEKQINRWFDLQREDFVFITEFADVKAKLQAVLSSNISESEYEITAKSINEYLQQIKQLKPSLQEISLLNRSNKIIISSNINRVGKYELLANVSYVEKTWNGNKFAPIFYVSPETGKPAVTFAKTLRDDAGVRQGIVLANLKLERIDEIVREGAGLGKTGETYLVGSLGRSKKTFIANNMMFSGYRKSYQDISSEGIDLAMGGISGAGEYRNHAGIATLGEYRWLNDQDLALLVEITQEEAFAPARQLANTIMLIGLASAGVLFYGVYYLSLQLSIYRRRSENYSSQLEVKAQEAETANRAKSEFLANMSHELRTPLNAILGFAQLMKRDKMLSLEQRESLTTINRSGEHLLCLINDVLDMSKIEAGRTILHSKSFDLHLLLDNLQEMFQLRATAKGLFLKFDFKANLPRFIITDEGKLRQVLINLLGNAIKFTEIGGVILTVSHNHNFLIPASLHFEIKDTGKGIAPEEIDQIFDPFVQTASGVQARGGTGLGLAISRQFVRLMGGDIYVNSSVKKGSSFSFDIQISLPKAKEIQLVKKQVIKIAPSQPNYRILVVDDRLENRDLLTKLLSTVGFETCSAANGKQAIAIWETWQPHLIWMDMRMAIMDGYEATRLIKAQSQNHHSVVIALTASAFAEQQSKIFAAGCDDLVSKPFQEEVIFEKMSQYLGVKYIYEEDNIEAENNLPANSQIILTSNDLSVMSREWIASLHQAALEVDADLILQIIEQIPQKYQTLAEKLRKLILQYDFDTIVEVS
ncbi:MAG: response regulator [Richelia sp. RM2_1_2]|nr:response regulator [Richelia sp. RM1_1_1]NJO57832.1 response regulator [Richelia sp. RM2_1_2]